MQVANRIANFDKYHYGRFQFAHLADGFVIGYELLPCARGWSEEDETLKVTLTIRQGQSLKHMAKKKTPLYIPIHTAQNLSIFFDMAIPEDAAATRKMGNLESHATPPMLRVTMFKVIGNEVQTKDSQADFFPRWSFGLKVLGG